MQVIEQGSRRRAAWFFMAFAFATLVVPQNRSSRQHEDQLSIQVEEPQGLGKTPFGVDHRASVQSPAIHSEMGNSLLRDDLDLEKVELNFLEKEKNEIEQELAAAIDALASLQEEKTTLENKLGEVLSTSNAQKEELEAMARDLHVLKQEFLVETRNASPKENSEGPGSWTTTDSQQTFGQKLRMFLPQTSGNWNLYSGDFRIAESSMSSSYSKSRDDMLRWLNTTASSVGQSHAWLEISSQIVVAYCDFLLLLVEMFVALLCVDFALSSFINWSQERFDRNGRTPSSAHSLYSQR